MNKVNWAQVAVFGVVALLVLLLVLSFLPFGWGGGRGPWDMMGQMMGPGMMGGWGFGPFGWLFTLLGLLFPLGLLTLVALGIVWLARQVSGPSEPVTGSPLTPVEETCPDCGRPVQAGWRLCPYCGQELGQMGETTATRPR